MWTERSPIGRQWNTCHLNLSAFWLFCWDADRSSVSLSFIPLYSLEFYRVLSRWQLWLLRLQHAGRNKEEKTTCIFIIQTLGWVPARMKFAFLYHFLIIPIPSLRCTWKGLFQLQLISLRPSLYRVDICLESVWRTYTHDYSWMLKPAVCLVAGVMWDTFRQQNGFIQKSLFFWRYALCCLQGQSR